MNAIDSTNDQNTMGRVIQGYIYTLTTKMRIKGKTSNCLIFNVIIQKFAKFGGQRLEFIRKRMYTLVNVFY